MRRRKRKNMKKHECVEAEMCGVAVCAASLVKGAGSEGKDERANRITLITAEETIYK